MEKRSGSPDPSHPNLSMCFSTQVKKHVSLFLLEVGDVHSPLGTGTLLQTASGGRCDMHQFYQFLHLPMHIMLLRFHIVVLIFDRDAD